MDSIFTADDIAQIKEAQMTVWQHDRDRVGSQTGVWMRPLYTTVDDVAGTGTRTLQIVKTLPVYYEHVPDVLVAQSGGVFQPDFLQVVLYNAKGPCWMKDLWYLEGRLYSIRRHHYHEQYDRTEMMVAPYSEVLDSVEVLGAEAETLIASEVRVRGGGLWLRDSTTGKWRRIMLESGGLVLSEEEA